MSFEVTKEFRFEMAHVLSKYNGKCGNLHGHSYRCLISFKSDKLGNFGEEAMVIDFNMAKRIASNLIDSLDHCYAYNQNTDDAFELDIAIACKQHGKRTYAFTTRTTAEEMSKYIYEYINDILNASNTGVSCSKVQLFETATGNCVYGG